MEDDNTPVIWHLPRLLREKASSSLPGDEHDTNSAFSLIVLNQPLENIPLFRLLWKNGLAS
jgi:hypothetical protein